MPKKELPTQISRLERRRRAVLTDLLLPEPLVRGSLTHVVQRCGKPSCHCAKKPSHGVWRLMTSSGGAQRCQRVRQQDVERLQALAARSKAFANGLRELEAIHRRQRALLDGLRKVRDVGYD